MGHSGGTRQFISSTKLLSLQARGGLAQQAGRVRHGVHTAAQPRWLEHLQCTLKPQRLTLSPHLQSRQQVLVGRQQTVDAACSRAACRRYHSRLRPTMAARSRVGRWPASRWACACRRCRHGCPCMVFSCLACCRHASQLCSLQRLCPCLLPRAAAAPQAVQQARLQRAGRF